MAILRLVLAFFLTIGQFFTPYFTMISEGGIDKLYEEWSKDQAYTADYAVTIEKDPNKDFVVLNFADIQLSDDEVYGDDGAFAEATIKKAIEETKPDLITLTGDNGSGKEAYIRLVQVFESYGIPWAPVMGNHDGSNGKRIAEAWCGLQLRDAEHCVFKFGPKDMGVGNYVINITENGKVIHSIYMIDTHTETTLECGGYDHMWDNQIEWYEWAVKGNNALAGKNVESSIFFHIPNVEYKDAWNAAQYDEETGKYLNPDYADSFGDNGEGICSPNFNSGFFDVVKELGSTKNIIAGHDHKNDSSILYQGVRLSYGLKTASGSYSIDEKNGGSTLTINSDGQATFAHCRVDKADLGLD